MTDIERQIKVLGRVTVTFVCEQYEYFSIEKVVYTEPTEINNIGNIEAEPILTVYGTGDIDLVIAQQVIKLKGVNEYITLDTPLLEAYKDKELQNSKVNGEFSIFPTGTFAFRWNGSVTKVEIIPNWRCL